MDTRRVIEIAERCVAAWGYVIYRDFHELHPIGEGGHPLFRLKRILKEAGYVCHEHRDSLQWWGKCSYPGLRVDCRTHRYTHFHKGGTQ
jgi:hypothetical protein